MAIDLLSCPVCYEPLSEPKVLPGCGHTLCGGCVQQLCARHMGRQACPVCRQVFQSRDVRTNFAVQALLAEHERAVDDRGAHALLPNGRLVRDTDGSQTHAQRSKQLEHMGVPAMLASTVAEEDARIGKRIFILDNSRSMQAHDGKRWRGPEVNAPEACTRWEELKQMAMEHAVWNANLGMPCEFLLLNPGPPPVREGIDFAVVDSAAASASANTQIEAVRQMLAMSNLRAGTPLAERIRDIRKRIASESAELTAKGQSVFLIIATDGLPTLNGHSGGQARADFIAALRQLAAAVPVNFVVRMCTQDRKIMDFYNQIDEELEFPLDVLDDCEGEAQEIAKTGNAWFAYTPVIHRVREGGTFVNVLDIVDERRFSSVEAALLAQLLIRRAGELPLPRDPEEFCRVVQKLVRDEAPVLCVRTRRFVSPVNVESLRVAILGWWSSLRISLLDAFPTCTPGQIVESDEEWTDEFEETRSDQF